MEEITEEPVGLRGHRDPAGQPTPHHGADQPGISRGAPRPLRGMIYTEKPIVSADVVPGPGPSANRSACSAGSTTNGDSPTAAGVGRAASSVRLAHAPATSSARAAYARFSSSSLR